MFKKIILGFFAAATVLSPLQASAAPLGGLARPLGNLNSKAFLATRSPTLAPFAHVRFCLQNPDDCQLGNGISMISLSGEKRAELARVNSDINKAIRPVNDNSSNPLGDVWQANVTSGDCEDFALTKRRKLISLGWPSGALRIAVARTSYGEGHAVLVVKTSEGDLVLDNRNNRIRPWNRTGLRWIKIQSGENPHLWYDI